MGIIATIQGKLKTDPNSAPVQVWGLILANFLTAQFYVLMEWVFFVSKPSFLDVFSIQDKLGVLIITGVLAAGFSLLALGVFYAGGSIVGLQHRPRLFYWMLNLLPACILGTAWLLLVDNFTYTLFGIGIATAKGVWRGFYALLFLGLIAWSELELGRLGGRLQARPGLKNIQRNVVAGIVIWLATGFGLALLLNGGSGLQPQERQPGNQQLSYFPHILWITGDGLSAEHLSVYGYGRNTTPYLNEMAKSSLVGENVFSNAKNTAGSLVSMFTGKDPLLTRVLYAPDILRGKDAYQHLPGILRAQGYFSIQYGYTYYADAYTVNMLDAFDIANGRSLSDSSIQTWLREYMSEEMAYFVSEIGNRITDRIRHIFYIKTMQNPYDLVVGDARLTNDDERIETFIESLAGFQQPMFIHLHLMGTHGPRFELKEQVFSLDKDPTSQGEWETDFYDDAILEFDANVNRIVEALEQQGLLENTLLIIGSDHAAHSIQRERIPLLIRFPGGEITGKIEANLQGLDIAPTILDYLGLAQPDWMSGQSLLGGEVERRYIFGAGAGHVERSAEGRWRINPERNHPPFYQVGTISVIDCQRWYELSLSQMSFVSGDALYHSSPCPVQDVLTIQEAYAVLLQHLSDHGFEVQSLEGVSVESLVGGE